MTEWTYQFTATLSPNLTNKTIEGFLKKHKQEEWEWERGDNGNKQQKVKVSKAEWDTDQWENENISESTEAQNERKGQEPRGRTKEVPGYCYHDRLILAMSVTVVVMILSTAFCIIEIHSHKTASEEGKEGSSRGFFRLLRKRPSSEPESQMSSFWRRWTLWLRDTGRPLSATRKENMTQKTQDQGSSNEKTINKDNGEFVEVIIESGYKTVYGWARRGKWDSSWQHHRVHPVLHVFYKIGISEKKKEKRDTGRLAKNLFEKQENPRSFLPPW